MTELLAVVIAIVLAWLGIERSRNKKKDQKIQDQAQVIEQGKKQEQIYQVALEIPGKISQGVDPIDQDQKIQDQAIQEAGTDEEVIQIAQSIIDNFNRSSRR